MDENKIIRRFNDAPEIRKVDEETRTVEFVGYMHDVYGDSWTKSADPDDVIGKGEAWVEDGKLLVRITFEPADLNPKSDKIFRKLQFGSLHAVSVGFRATAKGHKGDEERGEDPNVYYYGGQELLEVSVVNIPSNANALKRAMEEERATWEVDDTKEISETVEVDETAPETDYTSTIARARALLAKIK